MHFSVQDTVKSHDGGDEGPDGNFPRPTPAPVGQDLITSTTSLENTYCIAGYRKRLGRTLHKDTYWHGIF